MADSMIKTDKFNAMIQAFDCDFDLACQGEYNLSNLQKAIQEKQPRLLEHIELLNELAFLLRHGKAEIHIAIKEKDKE